MTYDHIQKSMLYLLFLIPVVAQVAAIATIPNYPLLAAVGITVIFTVEAFSFRYLRVLDEGNCLAIRFGPIPIFRKRILYSQITDVGRGRSSFMDGWGGMHWRPGRGWIWNLWGSECVVVHRGRKTIRIGTDDVEGLVGFLKTKISQG